MNYRSGRIPLLRKEGNTFGEFIHSCFPRKTGAHRAPLQQEPRTPLPHADALLGIEIQLLIGSHGKRGVPGIQVADSGAAVLVRSMTVRRDLPALRLLTGLRAPALRKADEEILIPCRLALQRKVVSVVRGGEPSEIGDVLAEGLMSIDRKVGKRMIGV